MESKKHKKTCENGHLFDKSSDCPTCPVCEEKRKPTDSFLGLLVAPARRALEKEKIDTLEKLSGYSEEEIMNLHGFGKNTMERLKKHMAEYQVFFKDESLSINSN